MSRFGVVAAAFLFGLIYSLLVLISVLLKAIGLAFLLVLVYCILTLVGIVPPIDLPLIP